MGRTGPGTAGAGAGAAVPWPAPAQGSILYEEAVRLQEYPAIDGKWLQGGSLQGQGTRDREQLRDGPHLARHSQRQRGRCEGGQPRVHHQSAPTERKSVHRSDNLSGLLASKVVELEGEDVDDEFAYILSWSAVQGSGWRVERCVK